MITSNLENRNFALKLMKIVIKNAVYCVEIVILLKHCH